METHARRRNAMDLEIGGMLRYSGTADMMKGSSEGGGGISTVVLHCEAKTGKKRK
jgi:hypothetical protein